MKPIRGLNTPTPGITAYLVVALGEPNWDEFKSHDSGASYRELVAELRRTQHTLCGYCEIELLDNDRQVEHIEPRSRGGRVLDPANLIACCTGGSSSRFGPERTIADKDRYLEPLRRNLSCGQAKGDESGDSLVDPRTLSTTPLFRVQPDGHLEPSEEACIAAGMDVAPLRQSIEMLGLNVDRLQSARRRHRDILVEISEFDDDQGMVAWVRANLRPNENGDLGRFFTTSRSFFGELAERVLEEELDWV